VHDELQFAGGELPNQVLHSDAANSQSQPQLQSSPYSQCDAKHSVPDGLYLDPAGVPERMCAELAVSLRPVINLKIIRRPQQNSYLQNMSGLLNRFSLDISRVVD